MAVPEFLTEIGSDVLVPCVTVPKSRLPGKRETAGEGFKPVPFSWADSIGGDALSVIVNAAVRLPAADGVKDIRTEHDWPGGRADGTWQVSDIIEKSPGFAPVNAKEFKLRA